MQSGRYYGVSSQAEITRKAQFDSIEARERRINSEDPTILATCYPGGNNVDNLKVYPGEFVIGKRKKHAYNSYAGRPSELGFTGLAGLNWGEYGSDEAMMRDFYPIGIAKTEFEYGKDNFAYDDPLDHGFSCIGAGTGKVNNWSGHQIHAGDIMIWEFPRTNRNNGMEMEHIQQHYRAGTPKTKPLVHLVPLRTTKTRVLIDGIISTMSRRSTQHPQPGIYDLLDSELKSNPNLTSLQEEAMGLRKFIKIFLGSLAGEGAEVPSNERIIDSLKDNKEVFQDLLDTLQSALLSKMSRIAGISTTSAGTSKKLEIMISQLKKNKKNKNKKKK